MSNDRQHKSSGKPAVSTKELESLLGSYREYLADQRRSRVARSRQSATPTTHSSQRDRPEQSGPVEGQRGAVDTAHRSATRTSESAHCLQPSKGNEGKGNRKTRSSKGNSRYGSRKEFQNKHVTFGLTTTGITHTRQSSVPDGTLTTDTGYSFLIPERDDPFGPVSVAATRHTPGDTLPPGNMPAFSSSSLSATNMADHGGVSPVYETETDENANEITRWACDRAGELLRRSSDREALSSSGDNADAECETDPEFGPG